MDAWEREKLVELRADEARRTANMRAEESKKKALELEKVRDLNRRERDSLNARRKELREQSQHDSKMGLEQLKAYLSPQEHKEIRHTEHVYGELEKDSEQERQKDIMLHEVSCDLLREKYLLQIRQKFGEQESITDQEIQQLASDILGGQVD